VGDVIPGVVIVVVLVVVLGTGTVITGLTPPPSSSVAPNGIVPPLRVLDAVPGADSGEAVPPEETAADDVQPAVDPADPVIPVDANGPVDPVTIIPPASNVELGPMVDDMPAPAVPASPEDAEPTMVQPNADNGLKPPGSSSVAPSGTPVGLFPIGPLEPMVVRGDVNRIPGVLVVPRPPVVFCATAAPQLNKSAAAIIERWRIHFSSVVVSIGIDAYGIGA
jgi:hypothetical protein